MKLNKTILIIVAVVIVIAGAGTFMLIKNSTSGEDLPDIPAKSTVNVPEPDATEIETVATNNIPTTARAGSQSHAIYTSYSGTEASGYLTYESDPDNPASFTANKDAKGTWKVTTYKVLGESNL